MDYFLCYQSLCLASFWTSQFSIKLKEYQDLAQKINAALEIRKIWEENNNYLVKASNTKRIFTLLFDFSEVCLRFNIHSWCDLLCLSGFKMNNKWDLVSLIRRRHRYLTSGLLSTTTLLNKTKESLRWIKLWILIIILNLKDCQTSLSAIK